MGIFYLKWMKIGLDHSNIQPLSNMLKIEIEYVDFICVLLKKCVKTMWLSLKNTYKRVCVLPHQQSGARWIVNGG